MATLPASYDDWRLRSPADDRPAIPENPPEGWIDTDEWCDLRDRGIRKSLECLKAVEITADYYDDAIQLSLSMLVPEPSGKFSGPYRDYVNPDVSLDMRREVRSMLLDAVDALQRDLAERPKL